MKKNKKIIDTYLFLESIGIHLDKYGTGIFNNHPVRFLEHLMELQIGEDLKTFDRWVNSDIEIFDLIQEKDKRKLTRFVEDKL
jgi:hypothetical protein